ncbi:MAG: ABC transporter ATP-binding protein [Bacteroidaceae bacterium]|nr:ABC transporter ATP-binding protein [Bacteroidaceae bacterium]MBQ5776950.1 ABC transporter ATP-binding protein [Bacteroidaceae bacterium]MBR5002453.1 ABC transporter ATP-binding protein [Bacteroidaceae bacterium]
MMKVEDMAFSYRRNEYLLNKVNFEITPGGVYGLLGKNGSGKSTLLYLMTGLMFPQIGSVTINGIPSRKRTPEVLSNIYLLPEEFDLPEVSADVYVKNNAQFYPRFNREQFDNYLQIFELPAIKKLSQYSMGQKKKFIVSFALATNVPLLFMDEPTNGMDIPSKSQFRKVIALGMSDERSIIISTHQVRDLESMIDRVMVLHDNTMMLNESVLEIARKLEFIHTTSKDDLQGCIYSTFTPNGFVGVRPNVNDVDTTVDLETLFNAVIANPLCIKQLFV